MAQLDRTALSVGIVTAVGAGLPLMVVFAVADPDEGSPWIGVGVLALIAIFGLSGFRVGGLVPDAAVHGAVVGVAAFVVVQVALLPVIAVSDSTFDLEDLPRLVFNALLLSIVAMLGAMLGRRFHERSGR